MTNLEVLVRQAVLLDRSSFRYLKNQSSAVEKGARLQVQYIISLTALLRVPEAGRWRPGPLPLGQTSTRTPMLRPMVMGTTSGGSAVRVSFRLPLLHALAGCSHTLHRSQRLREEMEQWRYLLDPKVL